MRNKMIRKRPVCPRFSRAENELPRIAALRDMVGNINSNFTSQAGHGETKLTENVPSVPGFPDKTNNEK